MSVRPSITNRIPLTVQTFFYTLIAGMLVWSILDLVQTRNFRIVFQERVFNQLERQAVDERIVFDNYLNSYNQAVKLFVTLQNFREYVAEHMEDWAGKPAAQPKFRKKIPPWLPKSSLLRIFPRLRIALLLDGSGKVREVYQQQGGELSPSLLEPSFYMMQMSHGQRFLTTIDGAPYLLTAESLYDPLEHPQATIIFASPIDDEFLISALGSTSHEHIMAFWSGDDSQILVSNNPETLPAGTRLVDAKKDFAMIGDEFFDYGGSELKLRVAFLIAKKEVDDMTDSVLSQARKQRFMVATVMMLVAMLIVFLMTVKIRKLNRAISSFEARELGFDAIDDNIGDELVILDKRFTKMMQEVITARKIVKDEAQAKTKFIVENALDAVVAIDANGLITTWNPSAEILFGWAAKDIIGEKFSETVLHEAARNHYEEIVANLGRGSSDKLIRELEIPAYHRDGHRFFIEISLSLALSGDEDFLIAFIRDITARKKAAQEIVQLNNDLEDRVEWRTSELAAANSELRDFAYVVSHDLKAPLRAISQLATWLGEDYAAVIDDDGQENIALLIGRVKRMHYLIDGILQYSRVGRVRSEHELVDTNIIAREVINLLSPPEHITITINGTLPAIRCEKIRFEQVLQNFLSNAIKFNDKARGEIDISCKDSGEFWQFKISDNGPGIAERYYEKIFQIFQTLTPRDQVESTGIGLSIVKKIVEMHGGTVWLESVPDAGSSFFFTIKKQGRG